MVTLAEVVAREAAACPFVAAAWVSPHAPAFAVQAVTALVGTSGEKRGWVYFKRPPPSTGQRKLIGAAMARIASAFPDSLGYYFSTRSCAGSWPCVFRRVTR